MNRILLLLGVLLLAASCAYLTKDNSEETVKRVVSENVIAFQRCSSDRGGMLVGTVDLSFRILPNGSTSQISVKKSKLKDKSNLEKRDLDCVAGKVARLSFPSFNEKEFPEKYIEVNVPLNFIPPSKPNN